MELINETAFIGERLWFNMKKLFVICSLIATGFVSTVGYAKTIIKDCDEAVIQFSNIGSHIGLKTTWKKNATFPNPAKTGTVEQDYQVQCTGISVTSTSQMIEIKADSYDDIIKHLKHYVQGQKIKIFDNAGFVHPTIQARPYSYSLKIDLEKLVLEDWFANRKQLDDNSKIFSMIVPESGVVGYKADGGDLKPLIYDGKVHEYQQAFATANHLMIFVKTGNKNEDSKSSFEALEIDKANGILRIYKKYQFPN